MPRRTPAESKFVLRVPDDVASFLEKLHPVIKSHIRSGLKAVLEDPYSGKALKDELHGMRSYRIKRYRIIYRIRLEKPKQTRSTEPTIRVLNLESAASG